MKKIPTLFKRIFNQKTHNIKEILPEVTPGMEWVMNNEGIATVKYDGACCAIIDGVFYKRYDASIKKGRSVPDNAIKCQDEPDSVTGHLPCWVPCDRDNPADKWFWRALDNYCDINDCITDGTYEAVGLHFNANPYNFNDDILFKHGNVIVEVERSYEGIKEYLENHYIEGLVFWKDGVPRCKIKRSDFGLNWNNDRNT